MAASGEGREREGSLATNSFHTPGFPPPTPTLRASDALVFLPGNLLPLCSASRPLALREGFWLWELALTGSGSLLFGDWQRQHLLFVTLKKGCLIPNDIYWQKRKMKPTRRILVQQSQAKSSAVAPLSCWKAAPYCFPFPGQLMCTLAPCLPLPSRSVTPTGIYEHLEMHGYDLGT